jgi:hypothetical protein
MEVGYIQLDPAAIVLEPDQWSDMSDALDVSTLGRIYSTWSPCQGSGTRPYVEYV